MLKFTKIEQGWAYPQDQDGQVGHATTSLVPFYVRSELILMIDAGAEGVGSVLGTAHAQVVVLELPDVVAKAIADAERMVLDIP